jgi:putative FmdB family regulatory protein
MPLYEYVCRDCRHKFETLVTATRAPACRVCDGRDLEKQLSVFAVSAKSGESSEPVVACGRCGDPRGPGACSLN